MKYERETKQILSHIGGEANVLKVSHCFTRLRLELKDKQKVELEQLNKISVVKGSVFNNGQLQIIIGNPTVDEVYDTFLEVWGHQTEKEAKEKAKKSLMDQLVEMVTAVFIPIFPALVAGGLSKAILIALMFAGVVDSSTTTYAILNMIGDAAFYFLPMLLAFTSAKYFKCNQYVAVVIAAIMLHPTFSTMGESISFFGIPVQYVNYSATVFPIIIGIFLMSYVEKVVKKVIPSMLSFLLVPLITIFIVAPIMLIVVGPVINMLSNYVGTAVVWMLNKTGVIGGALFGGVYPILVFFGLHQAIPPIELQMIAQVGYDPLLGFCAAGNAATAGATLAVAWKSRKKDMKSLASTSAFSAFIGITEPALYGVVSNYKNAFIAIFAGGAIGGIVISLFQVVGMSIGPVPLAGIALFFGSKFIYYMVAILAAAVVAFAVLFVMGLQENDQEEEKEAVASEQQPDIVYAPMDGKTINLEDIPDPTFSSGVLGKGVGIEPKEGMVYAPFDGIIETTVETKHAVAISGNNKVQLLIHVGIDTVHMNGDGFELYVEKGQKVKKGQKLMRFDIEKIREAGYCTTTAIIVANSEEFQMIDIEKLGEVTTGEKLLEVK